MNKLVFLLLLVLSSCATPKNVIYFADAERNMAETVSQSYASKIQKDDLLSITIGSKTPELTIPFNVKPIIGATNTSAEMGYLVDANGDIVMPILGRIRAIDLTYTELAALIEKRIFDDGYIKDPTATIKLLNYKISVLGEVKNPGVKKIESERVTLLDALSLAGDLTIFGKRENISVIREENGKREIALVDISNKDLFKSPYYYLRPNDIIYVEPNKKQQRQSVNNPYLVSSLLSGTSLIVTIINFLTR